MARLRAEAAAHAARNESDDVEACGRGGSRCSRATAGRHRRGSRCERTMWRGVASCGVVWRGVPSKSHGTEPEGVPNTGYAG